MKALFSLFLLAGWLHMASAQTKTVVLTFDDGPVSHYSFVAPLLQQYGFTATFYICEFPGVYPDTTLQMNWRMVRAIADRGMEIGNHTKDHKVLRANNYDPQLLYIEQKCDSMEITRPTSYAYPAYKVDSGSLAVLKEHGYRTARIGGDRPYNPVKDNPYLIPAYTITKDKKQLFYQALQEQQPGDIIVYCFHGVPDLPHPWVSVEQDTFREYMEYLKQHGYRVIAMRDLK